MLNLRLIWKSDINTNVQINDIASVSRGTPKSNYTKKLRKTQWGSQIKCFPRLFLSLMANICMLFIPRVKNDNTNTCNVHPPQLFPRLQYSLPVKLDRKYDSHASTLSTYGEFNATNARRSSVAHGSTDPVICRQKSLQKHLIFRIADSFTSIKQLFESFQAAKDLENSNDSKHSK